MPIFTGCVYFYDTGPAGPAAAGPMFTPSLRHDDVTLALTRGYIVWPIEMDSARDFPAEPAGEQGPSFRIPVKFHPSKNFAFPARKFGYAIKRGPDRANFFFGRTFDLVPGPGPNLRMRSKDFHGNVRP